MADNTSPTDTLFIGNLDQRVTKRVLYDLCIQARLTNICKEVFCLHSVTGCTLSAPLRIHHMFLALQAGPVIKLHIPEAYPGVHKGYAFCQYTTVVCMVPHVHLKGCGRMQLMHSN